MYDETVLFISELDINNILTQRPNHLVNFLKRNFMNFNMISFDMREKLSKNFWNDSYEEFNQIYSREDNFEYYGIPQSNYHDNIKRIFIERIIMEKYLKHNFKGKKFDICIICHPFSASLIPVIKNYNIANKVVYEDLDDFVDYFSNEDDKFKNIIGNLENYAIANSDVVFSVSKSLKEFRINNSIYNRNHFVSNNGVHIDKFFKNSCENNDRKNLIYIGSLEKWAGIQMAIKGVNLLATKGIDISLEIYGSGPYEHALKQMTMDLKIDNYVKFKGLVKHDMIPHILSKFKIGVIVFENNHLTKVAHPIKLIEYMASGLAVVGSNFGEIKDAIIESKAGETINDEIQFADRVEDILKNNAIYNNYSENGKKYSVEFDWEKIFNREISIIQGCNTKKYVDIFPINFNEYISDFKGVFENDTEFTLQDLFDSLEYKWVKNYCTRIAIFGAGKHTEKLLEAIKLRQCKIVGLIDNSSALEGKQVCGHKVFSFNNIVNEGVDVIIISSRAFESEIYESIKGQCIIKNITIYRIYEDNKGLEDFIWRELYL